MSSAPPAWPCLRWHLSMPSRTWPGLPSRPAKGSLPPGSGTLGYCRQLSRNKVPSGLYKRKSSPTACSWLSILPHSITKPPSRKTHSGCACCAPAAAAQAEVGSCSSVPALCNTRAPTHACTALLSTGAPGAPSTAAGGRMLDVGGRTREAGCWM